jgi:hypothetical protein
MVNIVQFGKYKGKPKEEMFEDANYMQWLEAQEWFRKQHKSLLDEYQKTLESPGTPEHNKLQTLFLNQEYLSAFINVAKQKIDRDWPTVVPLAKFETAYGHKDRGAFTIYGYIDVEIFWGGTRFAVEIKPTVGDDYPNVIRQLKKLLSMRFWRVILFVERYIGEGATKEQFIQICQTADIDVIFKDEVVL